MPDFSQPGDDGEALDGFAAWRRGVTYTVRREMLFPLARGREYRISATVRRKIAHGETFTAYGDLYQRCIAILNARVAGLSGPGGGDPLHTWIVWHAWWRGAVADTYPAAGDYSVACASITLGLVYPKKGESKPRGNDAPERWQLTTSGGAMAESSSSRNIPAPRFDEAYIDFDFNDRPTPNTDTTLSYGEYFPTVRGFAFEPVVQRAENLARFHCRLPEGQSCSRKNFPEIVRREWFRIRDSNLAVVMVYFRAKV